MNIEEILLGSQEERPRPNQVGNSPFLIATIHSLTGGTRARLVFPGDEDYTTGSYPILQTGATLLAGRKVLVAKVGGTFVILGEIGS